ncbi:MAG: single-stranded DNA-binding protein [Elusimicrobia bacterium]|nr:single-stranded DNA-binding protein [Elusimicrobiota bacterium]
MANLNKVMLIGRLTRDPEIKTFGNGGKVANVGFAVNNRRKNKDTGQWEDAPVWVDLKAFNRETGRKLADLVEQSLRKGQQVYVEGHLVLEEWSGKEDGKKQSKMVVYVDDLQFLEKREGGAPMKAAGAASASSGAGDGGIEEVPF